MLLSQPIRFKTETNHELGSLLFPPLASAAKFTIDSDWFVAVFRCVVIGQCDNLGFDPKTVANFAALFLFVYLFV